MRRIFLLSIICLVYLSGCASRYRYQALGDIYNSVHRYQGIKRNPVILINGIMGTKLVDSKSHEMVWGSFYGKFANPNTPEGLRLFAHPMQENVPLNKLQDSAVPSGVIDSFKVSLFGFPYKVITDYHYILIALDIGGYRVEKVQPNEDSSSKTDYYSCFQYDYDWRRDNVESAIKLHEFILNKRAYIQKQYEQIYGVKDYDVKFDIVSYSMGGLLARYYVMYGPHDLPQDGTVPPVTWEGSRYVNKLVIVGSPNAGSNEAVLNLINGRNFGFLMPKYTAAVLGTFPSIYELLPRGRHGTLVYAQDTNHKIENILDPKLWERMHWGLASRDADKTLQWLLSDVHDAEQRHQIALDHQRKCLKRAEQFTAALDQPAIPPKNVSLYLVAGDGTPTVSVVAVDTTTGAIKIIRRDPGDIPFSEVVP